MNKPAFTPRPGGGFNQGLGNFNEEHLEDNAMQSMMQNKALSQQAGGSATPAANQANPFAQNSQQAVKPRPLGTLTEELITRPAKDIVKGLLSIFDLNAMLGIPDQQDDPQTEAKKKQMIQRYNNLNEEQKAEAKKRYDLEMQKKKQQQEMEAQKKQQEEQQQAQTLQMPSSPQKGPVGPAGSGKKRAVQQLEQDRKTLGGPKSVN